MAVSSSTSIDKVKILVLGDSGVGKSSLVHLICRGGVLDSTSWTVGVSLDVKLHEYREATPHHHSYWIELWDVGGNNYHTNSRKCLYNQHNGIILVHDLSNRKSGLNLTRWLSEVFNKENHKNDYTVDPEQVAGQCQVPILVIGTKLDQVQESRTPRTTPVAEEWGTSEIHLVSYTYYSMKRGNRGFKIKLSCNQVD